MSRFEIRQTTEQPTAAMRFRRPLRDVGAAMSEAFPTIYRAIVASGVEPAGMPLARYFDMGEEVTLECAIPVPGPFAGTDEVQASMVGGGEAAFTLHIGPYENLEQSWGALSAWVAEQGRTPAGPFWESYLDDPTETDESALRTELYIPLA